MGYDSTVTITTIPTIYTHYVYLLVTNDNKMFKTGITLNPKARIKKLFQYIDFDLKKSFLIPCYTVGESSQIEKLFRAKFRDYNILNMPKFSGSTEFYFIECFDDAFYFVYHHSFSLKYMRIKSIENLPCKSFNIY